MNAAGLEPKSYAPDKVKLWTRFGKPSGWNIPAFAPGNPLSMHRKFILSMGNAILPR
jgi:hypothetical protein